MLLRLRNRLLLLNMTIVSLVMLAAFSAIYFITYTNIQRENQSKLASIPIVQVPRDTRVRVMVPVDYSPSFVILIDQTGQVASVLSYIDMPAEAYRQVAEQAWSAGKMTGKLSSAGRLWQYRITSPGRVIVRENGDIVQSGHGHYEIAFLDITDSSQTLARLLITFILVGITVLVFLFGVSLHFANCSIRPIAENWKRQKEFVADASHELKTPLAIIGANADALLANGDETVSSQQKWVHYIRAEAERMAKLVNDMLYLARVEDTPADLAPFAISATVLEAIASMEAVMFERGINLTQTVEPGLVARGDGERIKRVVLELLDNAAKYTDDGGTIAIGLRRLRNQAVFSVHNSGEGIPPDRLPRVFDRFYRGDPSRSQATRGYGLGLSIAKAIVERSGGTIQAQSAAGGTEFSFALKVD